MVYFHAIDVVLGRTEVVRRAWQAKCHLPKIMFVEKRKQRKGTRTSAKLLNYGLFKCMITVKDVIFDRHKAMLRLYEKYCHEASQSPYWGDAEDDDDDTGIVVADATDEADVEDQF